MRSPRARSRFGFMLAAVAALSAGGLAACGDDPLQAEDRSDSSLDLVTYSTPQSVYEGTLEPAFNGTPAGEDIEFSNWFASSGDQSRAVENGFTADLVHLPVEPDITRLVDAGLVSSDYENEPNAGVVQESVVVFATRAGNPTKIRDWEDLVREGVAVVTPNPFTSGVGRWNIIAAYGQAINNGASDGQAVGFIRQMLENTVFRGTTHQDASARDALDRFVSGYGDILLTYENEAIAAIAAGEEIEYSLPDDTIRIETIAVVPEDAENAVEGQAFLDFLFSEEGQRGFAENGYRPADPKIAKEYRDEFPVPPDLFDIEQLGGWDTVATDFFDLERGWVAEIERDLGVVPK